MMSEIRTSIVIEAPPSAVWNVLSDFDSYPEWNPFVRSIAGSLAVGERLEVRIGAQGKKAMRITPIVTDVDAGKGFAWVGYLGSKSIFSGHHHFDLQAMATGTRFDHFEEFSGALSPVILGAIRKSTERGFDEMNSALKERVEDQTG